MLPPRLAPDWFEREAMVNMDDAVGIAKHEKMPDLLFQALAERAQH